MYTDVCFYINRRFFIRTSKLWPMLNCSYFFCDYSGKLFLNCSCTEYRCLLLFCSFVVRVLCYFCHANDIVDNGIIVMLGKASQEKATKLKRK